MKLGGSTSSDASRIASTMRKMQEDPLFLIKKKEIEHHKNLVANPLLRERVKDMLKAEMSNQRSSLERDEIKREPNRSDRSGRTHYLQRSRSRSLSRGPVRRYRSRSPERPHRRRSPSDERRRHQDRRGPEYRRRY